MWCPAPGDRAGRFGWTGRGCVRATELVNRWGAPVITVSFLTIGFQTAVNAAAGLTRMPFGRYLMAMIPGCLAWALLYATVGLAAVGAALAVAASSPWALVGIVLLIAAGAAAWLLRRRAADRDGAQG